MIELYQGNQGAKQMTISLLYKAEERKITPAKVYTVKNIVCIECREISFHKSNATEHYLDELTSRKIKSQVREIVFLISEDYHLFTNNLLDYYDWLSNRGGDDSHYKTKDGKDWTTPVSDYKEIAEWKKESYTKCILVTNGSDYILVDPQKQRYAQYVGWGIKTTLNDILEVAQLQLLIPPLIEPTTTTQPKIWQDATPKAQVNDIIRKPFCPIARVVGKKVLKDGRTCLLVTFPGCRDRHAEEWVLPAVEVLPEVALTPATSEADQQPPGRGDGRGRVLPIAKHDKTFATIFNDRPKQYQQFLIIREELRAIGIKFGKLIKSREDVKGWNVSWDGDKAGLFWTIGKGWEMASLKYETEPTGNWEGFDLMEHLDCNGIELPE